MERQRSNSDLYQIKNSNNGTPSVPKRQNLVLSTSFVSTRRFEDGVAAPSSPLLTKHRSTTINNLRSEIASLELEIDRQRKRKVDHTRWKNTSNANDIYVDKYSTDHLENHSMRLRANSEIRDTEINIKRLQEQLKLLKLKLKKSEAVSGSSVALTRPMKQSSSTSTNVSEEEDSDNDFDRETVEEAGVRLTPTKSIPTFLFQSDDRDHSSEHLSVNVLYESPTKETATWLISDHLQSLQDINASVEFILQKANGLVLLLQKNPEIKEDLVITAFASTIQNLLLHSNQKIRSAGYRIVRYLILDEATIDFMMKLRIDAFITISLGKDNSHQEEREQAIKLVRRLIDFSAYGINKAIVQALTSCVELQEDTLRLIAFETLVELALIKPELIDECHAFPIIQGYVLDPVSKDEQLALDAVIQMLSYPRTRPFFIKNFHTAHLLSGFSDYQSKISGGLDRLHKSIKAITRILQSFEGLLLFSLNECELLKQLISFAQSPSLFKHVINIFMVSLRIKRNTPERTDCSQIHQYVYLLIVMMNNADFVNKIIRFSVTTLPKLDQSTKDNTTLVIAKVFDASMQLSTASTKFNTFQFPDNVDHYRISHETYVFNAAIYATRSKIATTSVQKIMLKSAGSMQLNSSKKDIDEVGFKKMVFDSKVLQTKSYNNWNWQVIGELCKSPLMNKKRLEELAKSTKFIRRMLVFYRPFRFRFTSVSSKSSMADTYVEVGCLFFRMLLSSNVGFKILTDDTKMIPQIASVLYNNMQGNWMNELLFTEEALNERLCKGYFKILFGVFTENNRGMTLLEKWNVFTVINKMFSKRSICAKYLVLTLPQLNLHHSKCKMFLNKALIDERDMIRSLGTTTLGEKLQNLGDQEIKLEQYLISLACRQLYDLSPHVIATADKILYDYFSFQAHSSKILQSSIKNCLDQLIFIGSPTLLKLMETSEGFKQLNKLNYISKERANWRDFKNKEFVSKVEQFLDKEIREPEGNSRQSFPLHFYQYLCKSEEGANLLSKSDDLRQFISVIKLHVNSYEEKVDGIIKAYDEDEQLELKSCMWACGFIGSTDFGITLLDKFSFVQDIVQLANDSQYTTIKNTAFYVLGLITYTMEGREMLEEAGWESIMDPRNQPIGVCVPKDASQLLHWSDLGPVPQAPGDIEIEWTVLNGEPVVGSSCGEPCQVELSANVVVGNKEILLDSLLARERSKAMLTVDHQQEQQQEVERVMRETYQSGNLEQASSSHGTNTAFRRFEDDTISDRIVRIVGEMGNNVLLNGAIKEVAALQSKYGASRFRSPEMFEQIFRMMGQYRFKPAVRRFLFELFIDTQAIENLIRFERTRAPRENRKK